jgi:hypothetical protein
MLSDYFFTALPKRKIFVSYHHGNDRFYYEQFVAVLAGSYEVVQDNSVDRIIDSDNTDYVIRCIREDYITGSSCTVVLCGAQTPGRKFVDWEIKATLDACHGLIGLNLPSNPQTAQGTCLVPDRLNDNILSSYALWLPWNNVIYNPILLAQQIEMARSRPAYLIDNSRQLRRRNG